jgi:hypothetical protein
MLSADQVPQLAQQTEDTTFLCHFDGPELTADVARGPKAITGEPKFVDGKFGKALALGGKAASFDVKDNLDMRRGTIEFWLLDTDFNGKFKGQRRDILTMHGGSRKEAYFLQATLVSHDIWWRMYCYQKPDQAEGDFYKQVHPPYPDQMLVGKWHHIVLSWDVEKRQLQVCIDGEWAGEARYDLVEGVNPMQRLVDFPPQKVLVGENKDEQLVLDELQIFNTVHQDKFIARGKAHDGPQEHGAHVDRSFNPSREIETPHVPWATPYAGGTTKILVAQPWENLREVVELAERADVDYQVIPVTSVDANCADTRGMFDYEREDFLERIKQAQVVVLGGIPPQWFDETTWSALLKGVDEGKGLVWVLAKMDHPRIIELLKTKAPLPEYLQHGPASVSLGPWAQRDKCLWTMPHGKGRIALLDTSLKLSKRYSSLTPSYWFGMDEAYYAMLTRLVLWAADRLPTVAVRLIQPRFDAAAGIGGTALECKISAPQAMTGQSIRVDFVVRDMSMIYQFPKPNGQEGYKGPRVVGKTSWPQAQWLSQTVQLAGLSTAVKFKMAALPRGHYSVDCQAFDAQGKAFDWDSAYAQVESQPRIRWLQPAKEAYAEGEIAGMSLTFDQAEGAKPNVTLQWDVADPHERVLLRGQVPWNKTNNQEVSFTVPASRSKALWFRVALKRGDVLLQQHKAFFLIPRRREKAFYYTGYSPLITRLDELGVDSLVLGPREGNDAIIAEHDLDVYFWDEAPGLRLDKGDDLVRRPSLTDPAYQVQLVEHFNQLGPLLAREKGIGGLVVDEWEYAYRRADGKEHDLDHHPTSLAAFRKFLQKDYGSIEQLNRTWQTKYATWDDVQMVLRKDVNLNGNAAPLVDRMRFLESAVADTFGLINDLARKYDPDLRLGLSGTRPADGYNGYDYWKLHQGHMGAITNYGGPMPVESDSFHKPGDFTATWQGYGRNYGAAAGAQMWREFILGRSAFINYSSYPLYGSHKVDWTIAPGAKTYAQAFAEIDRGMAELIRGGTRLGDKVAIHYSQASIHIARLGLVPGVDPDIFNNNLNSLVQLLEDSGLQPQYVSYEQIERGEVKPGQYRALILPLSTALSDTEAQRLHEYVDAGGTVIADAVCGVFDQHGRARSTGALDDLFGVSHAAPPQYVGRLGTLTLGQRSLSATMGEPALRAGAHIGGRLNLDEHRDVPAMIEAAHGKGHVVLMNLTLADYSVVKPGGIGGEIEMITRAKADRRGELQALFKELMAKAGVTPQVTVERRAAKGVEQLETLTARYADGQAMYVMVQPNLAGAWELDQRRRNDATIHLPHVAHLYDLRTGQYNGHDDHLNVTLIEGEPVILALLPYRVLAVSLKTPGQPVRAGQRLDYTVTVSADARLGRHEFYITVIGPDGKERRAYADKLDGPHGTVSGSLITALNDPPGQWRIAARDVASGLSGMASFTLILR